MLQSFKLFLTLIILAAAIGPVGILSSILVNKISEITTESAQKELQLVVQGIAVEDKQKLELIMSSLQTLADNPGTVQATAKSPFGIKTSEAYRVAESMQKLLEEHNMASSIFLTNESSTS